MPPRSGLPGTRPGSSGVPRPSLLAAPLFTLVALIACAFGAHAEVARAAPPDLAIEQHTYYPIAGTEAAADHAVEPARAAIVPHLTNFIPVSGLPTEDVHLVEVATPTAPVPFTAVWPTEGAIHFFDETAETEYKTLSTLSPNIAGCDFSSNGTIGVFATLGYLYIIDMSAPAVKFAVALPGNPARRDISPMLVFGGTAVIYATGTEVTSVNTGTGLINWTTPLPSPTVEGVNPSLNSAGTVLFVPSEGFMTSINPGTGAVIATTPLQTTLVRGIGGKFSPGGGPFYLPVTGALWAFNSGTGLPILSMPLTSPLIEGNGMTIDPSGTFGMLPTLSNMVQVNLGAIAIVATYPFTGITHGRNQQVIYTAPGVVPVRALYATQGRAYLYQPSAFAVIATIPVPGTLVDGVDPAPTDAPGIPGSHAILPTLGNTSIIDMLGVGISSFPTPGVLRAAAGPKPGPMPGNKILQPMLGGVMSVTMFDPPEWTITTSKGIWVVDPMLPGPTEFISFPFNSLAMRGDDALPTSLLGPPEPAFEVPDPDLGFVTKCWEYKYAVNRSPYWWSVTAPSMYPQWVPFGVFGPPATAGYDILNQCKVLVLNPPAIAILNSNGAILFNFPLPAGFFPIGGLIWDYDNKVCKLRLTGQREMILDLSRFPASINVMYQPLLNPTRWYPVIDRINGWEVWVERNGTRAIVYDHLNYVFVKQYTLPARCIRRPIFDEQRKTVCFALSNRKLAFINTHRLRLGLPFDFYLTGDLGEHIVSEPVYDIFNHDVLVRLRGGKIAVVNIDDGSLLWAQSFLPWYPVGPIQVDCYNKIAKCYLRQGAVSGELYINLYPLAKGAAPLVNIFPFTTTPIGYPQFDSKDGYEFDQVNPTTIQYRNLFQPPIVGTVAVPAAMQGQLFIDHVNKYALVRIPGASIFWLDLNKVTLGLAGAFHVIALAAPAVEDIAFDTQGHMAAVHLNTGQVAILDMGAGTVLTTLGGLPTSPRQLVAHPFRELFNLPWFTGVNGGDIHIDVSPLRWNPPAAPIVNVSNTAPGVPVMAQDFTPPPPPPAALIAQLPWQLGDQPGVVHYEIGPGALEPGSIVQAINQTKFGTDRQDDPNEAVAEDDGSAEISVIAENGDMVCFTTFDTEGNAAPQICTAVTVDVPHGGPATFAFAIGSENPASHSATFRLALPARADVDLAIFDIGGRRVSSLTHGAMDAGEYAPQWNLTNADGRRVSPGVYFARVRAGAMQASVRVVVID